MKREGDDGHWGGTSGSYPQPLRETLPFGRPYLAIGERRMILSPLCAGGAMPGLAWDSHCGTVSVGIT